MAAERGPAAGVLPEPGDDVERYANVLPEHRQFEEALLLLRREPVERDRYRSRDRPVPLVGIVNVERGDPVRAQSGEDADRLLLGVRPDRHRLRDRAVDEREQERPGSTHLPCLGGHASGHAEASGQQLRRLVIGHPVYQDRCGADRQDVASSRREQPHDVVTAQKKGLDLRTRPHVVDDQQHAAVAIARPNCTPAARGSVTGDRSGSSRRLSELMAAARS